MFLSIWVSGLCGLLICFLHLFSFENFPVLQFDAASFIIIWFLDRKDFSCKICDVTFEISTTSYGFCWKVYFQNGLSGKLSWADHKNPFLCVEQNGAILELWRMLPPAPGMGSTFLFLSAYLKIATSNLMLHTISIYSDHTKKLLFI